LKRFERFLAAGDPHILEIFCGERTKNFAMSDLFCIFVLVRTLCRTLIVLIINVMYMKRIFKKAFPLLLAASVLAMSGMAVSCQSEKTMYERHQTNKGSKVKSNIKVRGTNKSNSHTTRTF